MAPRSVYYLAALIGSLIGGYLPTLLGASLLSFTTLFTSTLGSVICIVIVWKLFRS